ncbi:MAG: DUF748 domain-containing protein [Deltaproteobacteria bacterium]|nr:DUF748 domain-containing protein [Deltaproteobacteria bacterium]
MTKKLTKAYDGRVAVMFLENLRRWMRLYRLRWWGWVVLTVLSGAFLARVWLPHFVQHKVVTLLAAATPATVRLVDVDLNLLHGQLVLKGLSFTLPGEEHAVIAVDKIVGRPRLWSLLRGEKTIENLSLSGARITLVHEPDGRVNLRKLLPPAPAQPTAAADLPSLTIRQLQLAEVEIDYTDEAHTAKKPIQFSLYDLTTGEIALQAKGFAAPVSVQVRGSVNLGGVVGEGQVYWSRSETRLEATLSLQRLPLELLEPYLRGTLAVQKLSGEADASFHYRLQSGGKAPPVHRFDGAMSFLDVSIAESSSGQTVLQVQDGNVIVEQVDLLSRDLRIASLKIREPQLRMVQTPAGLNWATLLRTSDAARPPVEQAPSGSPAWHVTIGHIETQGGELTYRDSAWADDEVVQLKLEEMRLQHIDFAGTESPFSFRVKEGEGSATGEGTVHFSPLHVEARVQLTEVSLSSFQPFLARAGHVTSTRGKLNGTVHTVLAMQDGAQTVNVDGTLEAPAFMLMGLPAEENTIVWDTGHLEVREGSTVLPLQMNMTAQFANVTLQNLPQGDVSIGKVEATIQLKQKVAAEPNPPPSGATPTSESASAMLALQGEFDIQSFLVSQGPDKQELVSCYHTKGRITEGSRLAPLDLHLADVALEYPYAQGFRTAAGHIQIAKPTAETPPLLANVGEKTEATVANSAQTEASLSAFSPVVHVDQIVLIGGQLYVEDHAIAPVQTIYWQDIRIDLSDAAYPLVRPTAFALHAFNMDGALIEASGTTKTQNGQLVTAIHGAIDRLKLPRFNAYLAPLLGYQVRKGAVSVKWEIAMPGDLVRANAAVTLYDLGLSGKQSTSELEQQVGLSLNLIIALLKDLNGNINLNLPVEGRLSEPGFHVGGTLWQAIRDVLIGAVTSPLKLLGAIFSKSDSLEDFVLDPIRFVPGTSQPSLSGKEQVNRLRVFLTQRPELDLQISSAPSAADRQALQDQLVLAQLQLSAPPPTQTPPPTEPPPGAQDVSPEEEVRQFLLSLINQRLDEKEIGQSKLSPQAATLLESLRKTILVGTMELEQLAQSRLQVIAAALTGNAGIRSDRLHLAPDKLRGHGGPEVQYMIQAREKR